MNYVLTAVLLLAILLFASGIYRLERARKSFDSNTMSPEHLSFILKGMVRWRTRRYPDGHLNSPTLATAR